jgi:thymidylate synthase
MDKGENFEYKEFLESEFQQRQKDGELGVMPYSDNGVPVLFASGESLARAWENSLICLYARGGAQARTQYDTIDKTTGEYIEPPSMDCSMTMVVGKPGSDPLVHRAFPGGLEDLEEYRQEVADGIKNHWTRDLTNPEDKKWGYTYNERLTAYEVPLSKSLQIRGDLPSAAKEIMKTNGIGILLDQPWVKVENRPVNVYELNNETGKYEIIGKEDEQVVVINQLEAAIDQLSRCPFTRRAQAITWQPWEDNISEDPACLQSFWWRILPGEDGKPTINTNERFRSRDSFDAAFMNTFAFIDLVTNKIAKGVSERRGEEIAIGRYVDQSDSYHIYGKRRAAFEQGFLKQVKDRSFEDRTWTREFAQPMFEEAKAGIEKKIREKDSQ